MMYAILDHVTSDLITFHSIPFCTFLYASPSQDGFDIDVRINSLPKHEAYNFHEQVSNGFYVSKNTFWESQGAFARDELKVRE